MSAPGDVGELSVRAVGVLGQEGLFRDMHLLCPWGRLYVVHTLTVGGACVCVCAGRAHAAGVTGRGGCVL